MGRGNCKSKHKAKDTTHTPFATDLSASGLSGLGIFFPLILLLPQYRMTFLGAQESQRRVRSWARDGQGVSRAFRELKSTSGRAWFATIQATVVEYRSAKSNLKIKSGLPLVSQSRHVG